LLFGIPPGKSYQSYKQLGFAKDGNYEPRKKGPIPGPEPIPKAALC
jgi:hypothetical protein